MKRQIFSRREFLQRTGLTAAGLLALRRRAWAGYTSPGLRKFLRPLRTFTSSALDFAPPLPLADPDRNADNTPKLIDWGTVKATHYTIQIGEFTDQLHPDLGDTTLWGYYQGNKKQHLAGTILAEKDKPVQVTFVNELPWDHHILPVDKSAFFTDTSSAPNKTVVHLHGGFIPWISDGGPYDWFTHNAVGPSFTNNLVLAPDNGGPGTGKAFTGKAEYYYGNHQSARLMWYHEHAHDFTRLNAYAGVASGYVLRDAFENTLIGNKVLPGLGTAAEIPLIFQDKVFVGDDIAGKDPLWPGPSTKGSLWYPHEYTDPQEASPFLPPHVNPDDPPNPQKLPWPSAVPEMFGDTMLVNGAVYPFLNVEPRRYRFRVLNACNSRFMNLCLYVRDNSTEGITLQQFSFETDPNQTPAIPVLRPTNDAGPAIVQIGTEGGFLPAPAILNSPPKPIGFNANTGAVNRYNLLLGPGERADIVIDFKLFAGKHLILYNDAPAPFPGGDPLMDYFYGMMANNGDPVNSANPAAGFGPNTRTLLDIGVASSTLISEPDFNTWLTQLKSAMASRVGETTGPSQASAARRRILTLNETFDQHGRLIQMLGTDQPRDSNFPQQLGRWYVEDACTEYMNAGETEIWEIYNLTGDAHPIHFHLCNVQIINRQPFNDAVFPAAKVFTGPARSPDLNERGWKETVRMNPGEVTRVIMTFDLPTVPFDVPSSTRETLGLNIAGKKYHEYVWHCHILEHEEHDMMRPLVVLSNA